MIIDKFTANVLAIFLFFCFVMQVLAERISFDPLHGLARTLQHLYQSRVQCGFVGILLQQGRKIEIYQKCRLEPPFARAARHLGVAETLGAACAKLT